MVTVNHSAHQTLYDILGIPCGVGVDHIKDSYRLLAKKTLLTDGARCRRCGESILRA